MRPFLFILPLSLTLFAPAAAGQERTPATCSISYVANEEDTNLIKKNGWGNEGYASLCAALKARDAGLSVSSSTGVLQGRAYACVILAVYDKPTKVKGTLSETTTTISMDADTPAAERAFVKSLDKALASVSRTQTEHFQALEAEKARLRVLFTK